MARTPNLSQPPALPRELIDTIISALIFLHDNDPAYQWTHLRHITRYHRAQIELHFLKFWVPKLKITVTHDEIVVKYSVSGKSQKSKVNLGNEVMFMPDGGYKHISELIGGQLEDWQDEIMRTTYPAEEEERRSKALIIRLGEGVLDKGFTSGGIISDTMVPGLRVNPWKGPWDIYFDWKLLFTKLFGEDMLMRRFRKRLLKDFLPTIKVTKPEKRHSAIYKFLQESFQIQRREMVTDYRNYVADESRSCWHRFDITPYLLRAPRAEHPLVNRTNCPSIFYLIRREESVVFQIPGWESWDVREVVRLRAEEEMSTLNLMQCENVINSAARRREQNLRERWDKMLGKKEANEKTLEGYLKERVKW